MADYASELRLMFITQTALLLLALALGLLVDLRLIRFGTSASSFSSPAR